MKKQNFAVASSLSRPAWKHRVIASTRSLSLSKWCVAISLPLVFAACDDSSSDLSSEIPVYGSEATLPDICEKEVAKVDTSFFACLENKWVVVTDSAIIEKIKDGLDGDKLKADLEDLMSRQSSSSKKQFRPFSSEVSDEPDLSGDTNVDEESSSSAASEFSSDTGSEGSSSSRHSPESSSRHSPLDGESSSSGQKKSCDDLAYNPDTQFCDTRDGTLYRFVTIASENPAYSKKWMAENLNYQTANSWCGGGSAGTKMAGDCSVYGRLYTWAAAMGKFEDECGFGHDCITLGKGNVQGVCPDGWHVPTQDEWNALFAAVGGESTAGQKLKAQTDWRAYSGITNEDAYGFSALPAGYRGNVGYFYYFTLGAYFWSATQDDSDYSYYVYMGYCNDYAELGNVDKNRDFSVRCVKDSE